MKEQDGRSVNQFWNYVDELFNKTARAPRWIECGASSKVVFLET